MITMEECFDVLIKFSTKSLASHFVRLFILLSLVSLVGSRLLRPFWVPLKRSQAGDLRDLLNTRCTTFIESRKDIIRSPLQRKASLYSCKPNLLKAKEPRTVIIFALAIESKLLWLLSSSLLD